MFNLDIDDQVLCFFCLDARPNAGMGPRGGNALGVCHRSSPADPWTLGVRFRYYRDDLIHNSSDERSCYNLLLEKRGIPHTDAKALALCTEVYDTIRNVSDPSDLIHAMFHQINGTTSDLFAVMAQYPSLFHQRVEHPETSSPSSEGPCQPHTPGDES